MQRQEGEIKEIRELVFSVMAAEENTAEEEEEEIFHEMWDDDCNCPWDEEEFRERPSKKAKVTYVTESVRVMKMYMLFGLVCMFSPYQNTRTHMCV